MHDDLYERICADLFGGQHADLERAGSTVHEFDEGPLLVNLWRFWTDRIVYVWTWGDEYG